MRLHCRTTPCRTTPSRTTPLRRSVCSCAFIRTPRCPMRSCLWGSQGVDNVRADRHWNGGKILVAEDNYLLGEVVCDFLRECGLEPVGPFATVEEACQVARHHPLDGAVL